MQLTIEKGLVPDLCVLSHDKIPQDILLQSLSASQLLYVYLKKKKKDAVFTVRTFLFNNSLSLSSLS